MTDKIRVDYPAPLDLQRNRRRREEAIAEFRDEDGQLQRQLDVMDLHATDGFGVVRCASGTRISPSNRRMDWALVVPHDASHHRKNQVASHAELNRYLISDDAFNKQYGRLRGDESITEIATRSMLEVAGYLVKRGRTTTSTVGILNKIGMNVRWAGEASVTTEALAIPIDSAELWVKAGDAGSMIHDCRGRWVGLVVGLDYNEMQFIAAQDIIDDILETTGLEIQLA